MPSWNRPTAASRGSPRCSASLMASSYAAAASSSRPRARRASARSVRQTEAILSGAAVAGFRQELEPSAGLVEWTQRGLGLAALLQGPAETDMAHRQVVGRDLVGRLAGRRRLGERAAARAVRLPPPGRHRSADRWWSIRPGSGHGSSQNPSEPQPRARAPLPRAGAHGDGPGTGAGTPPSLPGRSPTPRRSRRPPRVASATRAPPGGWAAPEA